MHILFPLWATLTITHIWTLASSEHVIKLTFKNPQIFRRHRHIFSQIYLPRKTQHHCNNWHKPSIVCTPNTCDWQIQAWVLCHFHWQEGFLSAEHNSCYSPKCLLPIPPLGDGIHMNSMKGELEQWKVPPFYHWDILFWIQPNNLQKHTRVWVGDHTSGVHMVTIHFIYTLVGCDNAVWLQNMQLSLDSSINGPLI